MDGIRCEDLGTAAPGSWNEWAHLEFWFRIPGTAEDSLLGHVRLALDGRIYEHKTKPPRVPDDRPRHVRWNAIVASALLDSPLPGEWVRRPRGGNTSPRDDEAGLRYRRVCLPISEAQHRLLSQRLDRLFIGGGPQATIRLPDPGFHILRNNCATWPARVVGTALKRAPSGTPAEKRLIRLLLRRERGPAGLERALRRWSRKFSPPAR